MSENKYPTYEDHRAAWKDLAAGIASIENEVREIEAGEIPPNSKEGELLILGSGIETIGITLGEQKLIESADKVLYCVADPATIVWLKRLRPDALDLYVLYGEDKVRYTTYMQMTEAQLYWVRQGLKVVVIFYGHPGIFVLSTHRAIMLARREGYKATMKANVCALDTLCADLGVDPCHPGMLTHEATDALIRQKNPDPSLHVVLWQVGLIGELGYREQGYLNNNFSYFINWLQRIYGEHYEITHYVGSRYPTIPPVIEIYKLSALHEPEIQLRITGISTFYIPPRDVTPSNEKVVTDLGLIKRGQKLVTPKSPIREIGLYGQREMKAFEAFKKFRIPAAYKWQEETGASKFLIELRFDPDLQYLYEKYPVKTLADERFSYLSEKEKTLLSSRESGAIQIACKGIYSRSTETEKFVIELLTRKDVARALLEKIKLAGPENGFDEFKRAAADKGYQIELPLIKRSIDFINRTALFPWTGIYLEPRQKLVITIVGNQAQRRNSIIYLNDFRIRNFTYEGGIIKWKPGDENPYHGFLRMDTDLKGNRRILGKIWTDEEPVPANNNFAAQEVNPERDALYKSISRFSKSDDLSQIFGKYAVRTTGKLAAEINEFLISENGLKINGKEINDFHFKKGKLFWKGGDRNFSTGELDFLVDPLINSIEVYGKTAWDNAELLLKCYGSLVYEEKPAYRGPQIPEWAQQYLISIVQENSRKGGLLLWYKWEKYNFTTMVVNKLIAKL